MKKHWTEKLVKLCACKEAVDFGRGYKTFQAAWDACERGDWMLWLLGKKASKPESKKRRKLVFVAAQCARLALLYAKDPRVLACIEACEAWSRSEITIEQLREARSAAYAASAAAYAARVSTLKQCADIVRKHYPKVPK